MNAWERVGVGCGRCSNIQKVKDSIFHNKNTIFYYLTIFTEQKHTFVVCEAVDTRTVVG